LACGFTETCGNRGNLPVANAENWPKHWNFALWKMWESNPLWIGTHAACLLVSQRIRNFAQQHRRRGEPPRLHARGAFYSDVLDLGDAPGDNKASLTLALLNHAA
jgi:hypothetical protein